MERPFADSRPLGPFAQAGSSSMNTVLITCDFDVDDSDGRLDGEALLRKMRADLLKEVEEVGEPHFHGTVADSRIEDHSVAIAGRGVRVVYDTEINAVSKYDIDQFEEDLEQMSGLPAELYKMTVVSADR